MPAEKGSAFLLKVGDGAAVPSWAVIAGMGSGRHSSQSTAMRSS